ncbi:hypothetical protein U9M48_044837 [Paspalum notatum var. saurae]|uniref:Uncharacterized protein n=1 Tax=Paspalum notatum var. saurae TaxID=547442 RepID=A0AAQ3V1W7_PASNO
MVSPNQMVLDDDEDGRFEQGSHRQNPNYRGDVRGGSERSVAHPWRALPVAEIDLPGGGVAAAEGKAIHVILCF